jgi:hypothetical protein
VHLVASGSNTTAVLPVIYDALKQEPGVLSATFEIEYSTYDERPATPTHQNKITDIIYDSKKKERFGFFPYISHNWIIFFSYLQPHDDCFSSYPTLVL